MTSSKLEKETMKIQITFCHDIDGNLYEVLREQFGQVSKRNRANVIKKLLREYLLERSHSSTFAPRESSNLVSHEKPQVTKERESSSSNFMDELKGEILDLDFH